MRPLMSDKVQLVADRRIDRQTEGSPDQVRISGIPRSGYETQPRVAALWRLAWVTGLTIRNPNGVVSVFGSIGIWLNVAASPQSDLRRRRNPFGVAPFRELDPRVAVKARQPWAELRNRFAVGRITCSEFPEVCRTICALPINH